ncbi:hypothetical protein [Streptomyces goshikiensis]|uniref:ATP-dependent DNA ligase n=1 Tax=Streptomyces goshikiensis TaxID=1942 RepID=UPI00369328E6
MVLTPPFEPMLAQAAEYVPGSGILASGFAAEQKFDGHRAILFTPTGVGGRLLLQTRRSSLVQDRFPDLVAAAEQLPDGLVLDGELVVWDTAAGRLSFEALQRRAAARGRTATALAAKTPAFFIAFDALQIDGTELLALLYRERRRRLEVLFAARTLTARWTLCPMTTDPDTAWEWLEGWAARTSSGRLASVRHWWRSSQWESSSRPTGSAFGQCGMSRVGHGRGGPPRPRSPGRRSGCRGSRRARCPSRAGSPPAGTVRARPSGSGTRWPG